MLGSAKVAEKREQTGGWLRSLTGFEVFQRATSTAAAVCGFTSAIAPRAAQVVGWKDPKTPHPTAPDSQVKAPWHRPVSCTRTTIKGFPLGTRGPPSTQRTGKAAYGRGCTSGTRRALAPSERPSPCHLPRCFRCPERPRCEPFGLQAPSISALLRSFRRWMAWESGPRGKSQTYYAQSTVMCEKT